MKLLHVYDAYVQILNYRISNALICCILNFGQLIISSASLGQHVYSYIYVDRKIFACSFKPNFAVLQRNYGMDAVPPTTPSSEQQQAQHLFLEYDVIIYDFKLFNRIWGIDKCIANYMDGGYMRFVWCVSHVIVIVTFLTLVACVSKPKSFMLWPILSMQTFYSIGLLVLTLSAMPKFLPILLGNVDQDTILPISLYIFAISLNFFLTYIMWHYYWHLCSLDETEEDHLKQNCSKHYIIVKNGFNTIHTAAHV